jgi:hypothetical protein
MQRRIAFVGLFPFQQYPIAEGLERAGALVWWVVRWRSEVVFLRERGVPDERILDTSGIDGRSGDVAVYAAELGALEAQGAPRIRDLVLMDRHLRRMPFDFCLRYLGEVRRRVDAFMREHDIEMIATVNDTALQILSLWVCRARGILPLVPAPARFPRGRFCFFSSHLYPEPIVLREPGPSDYQAARATLEAFRAGATRAAFYATELTLGDLVAYLPRQLAFFATAARWARHDHGVRHTRWTLGDLASMYLAKRRNLLWLRARKPYRVEPGDRPFYLYALHMQPESTIDVLGSTFSDQLALIGQIARATPSTHDLYVKIHRGDVAGRPPSFYHALRRIPGVVLVGPEADTLALLQRCDAVFTVSGTIAYEAGMLGRPAVTFAPMYFDALPTVAYCDAPPRLPLLLEELRARAQDGPLTEEIVAFIARMHALSFDVDPVPLGRAFTPGEVDALVAVYEQVSERILPAFRQAAAGAALASADGQCEC